jgi:hypothetical protein
MIDGLKWLLKAALLLGALTLAVACGNLFGHL